MASEYYTRSKTNRPEVPANPGSDVEPDDVAPVVATEPLSGNSVRFEDEAVRGPEPLPIEPAEPVPVQATPFPEVWPVGGGPGSTGPAGPLPAGISLRCPDGRAGPFTVNPLYQPETEP